MPDSKLINGFLIGTMAIAVAGAAVAQDPQQRSQQNNTQEQRTLKQASKNVAQDAASVEATRDTEINGTIFHAQVLLDRAGFSPGVIDGLEGISFKEAVRGFQKARGLQVNGELDQATRQALLQDRSPSTRRLRVDESDAQGPFVGHIPDDPQEQAKMERLAYRNLLEKIAEKFHTTPATIVALNDPKQPLRAGTVLTLPNVLPSSRDYGDVKQETAQLLSDLNVDPKQPKAERVVVDKSDKVVRVFGEGDKLVAQFPATIGSEKDPLPTGDFKVNSVAYNPPFKYQPQLFWDVKDSEPEALLPPGPNGPVGIVWIDINKPHIGIHGTNAPETIKRAESHGCIRLTNWDAARLTQMIHDGIRVTFQA
ncbi:MAG TPA: L,D-transpeptidase family protein [Allosphingosinicella sp.]|nr:L,D-transpeptidase family protein [Allosphingosinicella sp.]